MKILKKDNAWIWLTLLLITMGTSTFVLGALLDVYDKKAWYYRWTEKLPKWLLKTLFIIFILGYIGVMVLESLFAFGIIKPFTIESNPFTLVLSLLSLILIVLILVFTIQILCKTSAKLNVQGKEIYLSPYIWLLCIIIPIIGWIVFIVLVLYLEIFNIVMLYKGEGEKFIK